MGKTTKKAITLWDKIQARDAHARKKAEAEARRKAARKRFAAELPEDRYQVITVNGMPYEVEVDKDNIFKALIAAAPKHNEARGFVRMVPLGTGAKLRPLRRDAATRINKVWTQWESK